MIWDAIKELCEENADFHNALSINLIGHIDNSVRKYIHEKGLDDKYNNVEYVEHEKALEYQRMSDLLLLMVPIADKAEAILTGKLFEYLASGRPILAVAPVNGDVAKVIKETHSGVTIDYDDKKMMKEALSDFYQKYSENQLITRDTSLVSHYSRKNLTKDYAKLLNDLL